MSVELETLRQSIPEAQATYVEHGEASGLFAVKLTRDQIEFLERRAQGLFEYGRLTMGDDTVPLTVPDIMHLLVRQYMEEAGW